MRKLMICALCVLLSLSARAGFIDGIRISGYDRPFIVTIDNEDVSMPATSCFVAGLSSGYYTVEVYESRSMSDDDIWKGRLLYSKRVYYNGIGIMDIRIDGGSSAGGGHNGHWPSVFGKNVMSADVFADFYQRMKDVSVLSTLQLSYNTLLSQTGSAQASPVDILESDTQSSHPA